MDTKMFCYQCQEAAKCEGCTIKGACGKTPEVANLQDLLIYQVKGISFYANIAAGNGITDMAVNRYVLESLFATITNANFSASDIESRITEGFAIRESIKNQLIANNIPINSPLPECASWIANVSDYSAFSEKAGVLSTENEDIRSLRELIIYGLKGMAAYAKHADNLGYQKNEIIDFIHTALAATLNNNLGVSELVNYVMECGKYGVEVMALLDEANTTSYGHPEITEVNIGVRSNPGILISGHDLKDMEELLKQTEGTGIDVYTHSEMLPANYYPAFKKYKHFVGNYGSAWWNQNKEFESFNGPILMTTNCITPPKDSYKHRIYTTGETGFSGLQHIEKNADGSKDFSAIITQAKQCNSPQELEKGSIVGGFAHNQVMQLADKVVAAVKSSAIKKFIVMAGCDGRVKSRSYYTDFAKSLPNDTVILTAGCAKYRYNKLQLGDIGGIPRILDAGQCNDSYSLAVIALKLKEVFELNNINELPIVYNIAWYEQKAVIVLLALLYLGIKNIHLGPTLPSFLSPNIAKLLVQEFGISGIDTVEHDMEKLVATV